MKISQREYLTIDGSPGDILLRLFMRPLGLTAYRISADLGVPPIAISQILRGRRAISAAMALRLGTYFGVEPHFWLMLQSAHELQGAMKETGETTALKIRRCPALADRHFVIRESKMGTNRHFEVMMAKAGQPEASNAGTHSPPALPGDHKARGWSKRAAIPTPQPTKPRNGRERR